MKWDETELDFYEMRWNEIRMTWDQNEMRLNCDLWDETKSESTWDQNEMKLNSHSVRQNEWNQDEIEILFCSELHKNDNKKW